MINFLKYRTLSAIFSLVIFATFIGAFFYKRSTSPTKQAFTYSVDFTGGTQVLLKFKDPVSNEKLLNALEQGGWPNAVLREFSKNEIIVRVKQHESDAQGLAERIRTTVAKSFPDNTVNILKTDSVGGSIGKRLREKSLITILLVLALMLLYITIRFWSISYAVGAIVALFHDALIILTVFLVLDKEISINVIGAILAVLGYSINDTIVIFSRIRDNLKTMGNLPVEEVVNISLNQTIRRTILTTISTALVVVSLLVLGGETLRDLSLALLIGIIFGTYSSIYIASSIMLLLYKKKSPAK